MCAEKSDAPAYSVFVCQQVVELRLALVELIVFAIEPARVGQFVIDDFIGPEK